MEALLQYCWKHKLLPYDRMVSTDGEEIEVIDPGIQNYDAGPDFFNSKIKIRNRIWAGNVEIHNRSRDWYLHGHHKNKAFNNVILHVVETADRDNILTEDGRKLPQLVISVPRRVRENYQQLLSENAYPPCYKIIPDLRPLKVHSWMAALQVERLSQKTEAIRQKLELLKGNWEHALFISLARSLGMGNNSDALEQWAMQLPLDACAHHRDNVLQIEALFFGQAGMLESRAGCLGEGGKKSSTDDEYFLRLKLEYEYLSRKFSLSDRMPVGASDVNVPGGYPTWRLMRMRPQNFPHIRLAQLARLYSERCLSLSQVLECDSTDKLEKLLRCGVSEYWETHYTFGNVSKRSAKRITPSTAETVMINCVIPMLFAYGRWVGNETYPERAFDMLEVLKPEDNNITRMWRKVGLEAKNAGDSQALIQLKKQYCDRKDCLRCRIGREYLRC